MFLNRNNSGKRSQQFESAFLSFSAKNGSRGNVIKAANKNVLCAKMRRFSQNVLQNFHTTFFEVIKNNFFHFDANLQNWATEKKV